MKRCVLGLLVLLMVVAVFAEDEKESGLTPIGGLTFADKFELTVVNVMAHVTDKKGNLVTDLTKDDFRVFQDKQEKEISNFQLYTEAVYEQYAAASAKLLPGMPLPESTIEPQSVNMIVFIDHDNLHPLDRNRVLRNVRDFVAENLRPPMQMMVVESFLGDLKILQSFTSSSREVRDSLRGITSRAGGRPERDSARQGVLERMQWEIENYGLASGLAVRATRSYNDMMTYAEEEAHNVMFSIDRLREVVTFLAGLPGRKSVLYISNGLPMVPGLDLFNAFADAYNDPTILAETQRFDRSSAFKSVVAAANSQEVSFYTIGAGGLEVVGMSANEYRGNRGPMVTSLGAETYLESLRYIAVGTGGLAIIRTNDFDAGLKRIEDDLYTYYSLGYPLVQTGRDKVHHIKVTLPDHPELVIRFRRSFVEKSLETRVQDRTLAGLLHDLNENPMDLECVTGMATPAANDLWMVPMAVSFPIEKIALLPEGEYYVGRVVIFASTRDSDGKRSEMVSQESEIRLPAGIYEQIRDSRFDIDLSLLMEAGSYRVAIGLMDQITRQASYQTITTVISSH